MGAAHLRVIDFDGFDLDPESAAATCDGCFLVDFDISAQFPLEAVKANAPDAFPAFIRGDPQDRVIPLHITIREAATAALTLDRINELKEIFSPFRDPAYLRVIDENGITRRMLLKSLGLTPWEGHSSRSYVASLDADEPIWEADAITVTQPFISGSAAGGYSFPVTNDGNVRTYPEIRLVPFLSKGAANDFIRKWDVLVAWRSPLQGVDSQGLPYPVDIFDRSWDTATEIALARMQADGDDIRVFVDQVEVDRYLDGINTANTAVWCSIAFEPARVATVVNMAGAALPPTGADLEVTNTEGTTGFPDVGVLLIENEAVAYRGRSPTAFLNINRGWRHTTAVAHAADTPAYFVEHEIVVMTNYSTYASPLARDDREPMIDMSASDNRKHVYGADGFYEESSLRPGQWLRELRGTHPGAAVMAMSHAAGEVTMQDALPASDAPNFDALGLYTPCFVSPLITGVALDYEVDHDMLLEMFAVDDQGFETRQLRRDIRGEPPWPARGHASNWVRAAAPTYENGVGVLPAARLSRLTIHGRNYRITGGGNVIDTSQVSGDVNNKAAQSFGLTAEAHVRAVRVYLSKTPAGMDRQTEAEVWTHDLSAGPVQQVLARHAWTSGNLDVNVIPTSMFYQDPDDDGPYFSLPAGTYAWLVWYILGSVGNPVIWGSLSDQPFYSGGMFWRETATVWAARPEQDETLIICGDGEQQVDAPLGLGTTVKVRNVDVHLHDDYVPAFAVGAPQAAYFWQSTLENQTTGQILTFFAPHELLVGGTTIRVFTDEHRVEAQPLAVTPYQSRPTYMEPDDIAGWMHLDPGLNTLVYTEPSIGVGIIQVIFVHRDRWT